MKNKMNASQLQRKGIKEVYDILDEYTYFTIENQREGKELYISKRKDNLASVIQTIRKYKKELKELGVSSVTVFGSVARGEATKTSDIDLLLEVDDKVDLMDFAIMKRKIISTLNIDDLDIHNKRFIKAQILNEAKKDGINAF